MKCGVLAVQGVDFFFAATKKGPRNQFSLNSCVQKCTVRVGNNLPEYIVS